MSPTEVEQRQRPFGDRVSQRIPGRRGLSDLAGCSEALGSPRREHQPTTQDCKMQACDASQARFLGQAEGLPSPPEPRDATGQNPCDSDGQQRQRDESIAPEARANATARVSSAASRARRQRPSAHCGTRQQSRGGESSARESTSSMSGPSAVVGPSHGFRTPASKSARNCSSRSEVRDRETTPELSASTTIA